MKKILISLISIIFACANAWGQARAVTVIDKDASGYEALERTDGYLPDGIYEIASIGTTERSKTKTNPAVLFWDYDRSNSHIQLKARSNDDYQQFEVKLVKTKDNHHLYTIRNIHTNLYVDLYSNNMQNGATIGLYNGTGGTSKENQMWEICPTEDGTFFIKTGKIRTDTDYTADNTNIGDYKMWQPRLAPVSGGVWSNTANAYVKTTDNWKEHSWAFIPAKDQRRNEITSGAKYHIVPKNNPSPDNGLKHLTLDGTSDANGTAIVAVDFMTNLTQKITISYITSGDWAGYYSLQTMHQGKYFHTKGGTTMMGDPEIHQWENVAENACWVLLPSDERGYYYIINRSGRALDYWNNVVKTHRPNASNAQKYRLVREDNVDKFCTIRPAKAEKRNVCLDVEVGGANVRLDIQENTKKNQQWIITNDGQGVHKISAHHSHKCLDVNGGTAADHTNVQEWTSNDSGAQKWYFGRVDVTDDGKDIYYIINNNGYFLDANGGALNAGDNIQIYHSNDSDAQRWVLEPCTITKMVTDAQYATMWYSDLDLQVPEGLEAFTMKLNADDTDVVRDKTYAAGTRIPKNEAVVVHYLAEDIAAGQIRTFQFPVLQDKSTDDPVTVGNCLQSTGLDQDVNAESGKFIYRLTKGPKGVGFYMAAPANNQPAGKYLMNKGHLCYLQANFDAATKAVPNYVSLEAE